MNRHLALLMVGALAACSSSAPSTTVTPSASKTLKDAYAGSFMVGGAINEAQFNERDRSGVSIVRSQFNTVTSENILKWEHVHPRLGEYTFAEPDR